MENKENLTARFGYSWIENSRAARGAKIWKYIVFLTKTIVLLSYFKNLLWFFHNEWKHFFRIADRPSDIKSEVQLRYYIVIRNFYYMIYIWKQPSDSESEIRLELSDLFFIWMEINKFCLRDLAIDGLKILGQLELASRSVANSHVVCAD